MCTYSSLSDWQTKYSLYIQSSGWDEACNDINNMGLVFLPVIFLFSIKNSEGNLSCLVNILDADAMKRENCLTVNYTVCKNVHVNLFVFVHG